MAFVPLGKPQLCDDTELCLDGAKMLWAITDYHYRLLHRTPCNLGRPVDELGSIELSRTRDTEQGGCGLGRCLRAAERKVRVVFGGGMSAITQRHEGQERPVIFYRRVGSLFCAEPEFDFGAPNSRVSDRHATPDALLICALPLPLALCRLHAITCRRSSLPRMMKVDYADQWIQRRHFCAFCRDVARRSGS